MPRLVWFVLKDGRSLIANCDLLTTDRLKRAFSSPARLTLTSDDAVEEVESGEISDFVVFDVAMVVPHRAAIFNFVQLASS